VMLRATWASNTCRNRIRVTLRHARSVQDIPERASRI
jgi:hypothetical protein